jgi:hypothetical protein
MQYRILSTGNHEPLHGARLAGAEGRRRMGHALRSPATEGLTRRDPQVWRDRWTGLVVVVVVVALALLLVCVEVLGGPSLMYPGRYWPLLP